MSSDSTVIVACVIAGIVILFIVLAGIVYWRRRCTSGVEYPVILPIDPVTEGYTKPHHQKMVKRRNDLWAKKFQKDWTEDENNEYTLIREALD